MNTNEILDFENNEKRIETNYRKWAFIIACLFIVLIISVIGSLGLVITLVAYAVPEIAIIFIGLGLLLLLLAGLIFTILMIKNKEPRDFKYWVSIIVIPLLTFAGLFIR